MFPLYIHTILTLSFAKRLSLPLMNVITFKMVYSLNENVTFENAHGAFCGRTCDSNGDLNRSEFCKGILISSCFPCDCDDTCSLYGTCCPYQHNNVYAYQYELSNNESQPISDRLGCMTPLYSTTQKDEYYIVKSCPATWQDANIRDQCEVPTLDSLDSIVPHSAENSGLAFQNIFCAKCNVFEIKSKPWSLEVSCKHFQSLYSLTNEFIFVQSARNTKEICKIVFSPPKGLREPKRCDAHFPVGLKHSIGTCPPEAEPALKGLCGELGSTLGFRVDKYKNIFCAMCNNFSTSCVPGRVVTDGSNGHFISPIKLLFNFSGLRQKVSSIHRQCRGIKWENTVVRVTSLRTCHHPKMRCFIISPIRTQLFFS